MTIRNKRKLAALNKENCEENPRSNMAQNSGAPRSQEDYISQVSEEIEGRVTKRLSKEFSRTENRILGALARLDDFLMNPLLPGHSGTTPEPTRNTTRNNQGTNEDGSQNDPHPEAGLFHGQITRNVSLEEGHDRGRTGFARSAFHLFFGIWPSSKLYISTQRKVLKIWSTVFCIRVLRAIMPILSKIGLILIKGGTSFARSAFLEIPFDGGGYGRLPKITLGDNPFSLVCKGETGWRYLS